jgi:hypothetical protein
MALFQELTCRSADKSPEVGLMSRLLQKHCNLLQVFG